MPAGSPSSRTTPPTSKPSSRQAILTKTAQAQINDLQSMIDRYLDDEIYHAYSDQLEGARKDADTKAKAQAKKAALALRSHPR